MSQVSKTLFGQLGRFPPTQYWACLPPLRRKPTQTRLTLE